MLLSATYEEESRGGAVNIVAGVRVVVRKVEVIQQS